MMSWGGAEARRGGTQTRGDCRPVGTARSRTLEHLTAGEHETRERSARESNSIQLYLMEIALQGNS